MSLVNNRLARKRGYLCGPMDFAHDAGVGWRKKLMEDLYFMNIAWLDPTNKPCDTGKEGPEEVAYGKELLANGDYATAALVFTEIKAIDERMVDLSDFVIARLDLDTPSCGTHWEMCRANSQHKPVLTHVVQGKRSAPRWLFGALPHEMIFGTMLELQAYLKYIAYEKEIDTLGRWMFFDIKGSTER